MRTFSMAALAVALLIFGGFISKWHWPGTKPAASTASHLVAGGWQPAISPDGKLVAYLANRGSGPLHIWVSQTSGAGAIEVTSGPFEDYQPDFSPDGTRIVFVSGRNGHGIFTTSALPGEVKPLVVNTTASLPRFSPTGDRVLYLQDSKLFVVSSAGGESSALLPDQPFTFDGAAYWSPDASEILFYGVRTADKTTPPAWWIAPTGKGQPRLARLPGIEDSAEKNLAVRDWVRTADDRDWIVYTTSEPDNWKLWRIEVTSRAKTYQPQLLAEGTGGVAPFGSAARDGSVAYVVAHEQRSIYQIYLDHHGERSGPTEDLLSNYGGIDTAPSVSRDGRWMAYDSALQGKAESIRLRDLAGGTDTQLEELGRQFADYNATSLAPDGSKVIFSRMCRPGEFTGGSPGSPPDCGFLVNAAGDKPEQVCESCIARGFSADGSYVLLQKEGEGAELATISALNLKTRKQRAFFASPVPHEDLYHPFLSWDDRWVVFKTIPDANVAHSQLMIAPVHEGFAEGASRWIPITNGQSSDDKPQFSADGNTVFYTSGRDGFLCIWAQKLNSRTKRPSGPAVAFEHFHNPAGRGWIYAQSLADLSVARDKLLIALPQVDIGVWITKAE